MRVGKGATVKNAVLMPSVTVCPGADVEYAIVAQDCLIEEGAKVIGEKGAIKVVADGEVVHADVTSARVG